MRKILLLTFGIFLATITIAQEYQDVIYLKNGSIIKGEIINQDHIQGVIIKTSDGQLYSFVPSEIEQMLKEINLDLSEYGGNFSYGLSLGGGGIIGIPLRFFASEKFAFDINVNYKPGVFTVEDYYWGSSETYFEHSFVFGMGTNYYIGKYFKSKKQKVKLNGITLKGGVGTGGFDTYFVSAGWIHESFKKYKFKKSFTFELGPGFIYTYFQASDYEPFSSRGIGVYWKVQWNWFN